MPHFVPRQIIRKYLFDRRYKSLPKYSGKLYLSITVDVEHDYGSWGKKDPTQADSINIFFENFLNFLKDIKAQASFFIQADIAETIISSLKAAAEHGHELGLHGLHHELFAPAWFLKDKPASRNQQSEIFKISLDIFKKSGLTRPTAFRAPNLMIQPKTYELLKNYKFKLDSSPPAFIGHPPLPSSENQIKIIPVTADPKPQIHFKYGLPFSRFLVFNLANLVSFNEVDLLAYVNRISHYQKYHNCPPHLVFLCHSWEFKISKNPKPELKYCHDQNYQRLKTAVNLLKSNYDLECLSLNNLAAKLFT